MGDGCPPFPARAGPPRLLWGPPAGQAFYSGSAPNKKSHTETRNTEQQTMADTELGFSTSFLNTLQSQRSSLTSWLESEKSRIDSIIDEIESTHAGETERITKLVQRLDDVRVQRGLASCAGEGSSNKVDGTSAGGMAQQKRDLEQKQARLQTEVDGLREKNREGEVRLNGTSIILHSRSSCFVIHTPDCVHHYIIFARSQSFSRSNQSIRHKLLLHETKR